MEEFTGLSIEAISMLQFDIHMLQVCDKSAKSLLQKHLQQELCDKAQIYKDFESKLETQKACYDAQLAEKDAQIKELKQQKQAIQF